MKNGEMDIYRAVRVHPKHKSHIGVFDPVGAETCRQQLYARLMSYINQVAAAAAAFHFVETRRKESGEAQLGILSVGNSAMLKRCSTPTTLSFVPRRTMHSRHESLTLEIVKT